MAHKLAVLASIAAPISNPIVGNRSVRRHRVYHPTHPRRGSGENRCGEKSQVRSVMGPIRRS